MSGETISLKDAGTSDSTVYRTRSFRFRPPVSLVDAGRSGFTGYLATPSSGSGPGLILLQEIFGVNHHIRALADLYAEEGYVVLAPDLFWRIKPGLELGYSEEEAKTAFGYKDRFDVDLAIEDAGHALAVLRANNACTGQAGAIGFCLGGKLAYLAAARLDIDAAVCYYGVGIEQHLAEAASIRCPIALHFGDRDQFVPDTARAAIRSALANNDSAEIYAYPEAGHGFNNHEREAYDSSAASLAHSRSISLLRRTIGPRYNLEALWDKHLECEFSLHDVDSTLRTMTPEPYVNHVPTATGGLGRSELHRFYSRHFLNCVPKDTKIVQISRTVGSDRVVDESIFCFTHDIEIDWLLPGVKPTGKYVEMPIVVVIQFRGDKLCAEHIYWDQASVLAQVGLIEVNGLPILAVEEAHKVRNRNLPANRLMKRWEESAPAGKP